MCLQFLALTAFLSTNADIPDRDGVLECSHCGFKEAHQVKRRLTFATSPLWMVIIMKRIVQEGFVPRVVTEEEKKSQCAEPSEGPRVVTDEGKRSQRAEPSEEKTKKRKSVSWAEDVEEEEEEVRRVEDDKRQRKVFLEKIKDKMVVHYHAPLLQDLSLVPLIQQTMFNLAALIYHEGVMDDGHYKTMIRLPDTREEIPAEKKKKTMKKARSSAAGGPGPAMKTVVKRNLQNINDALILSRSIVEDDNGPLGTQLTMQAYMWLYKTSYAQGVQIA